MNFWNGHMEVKSDAVTPRISQMPEEEVRDYIKAYMCPGHAAA